MKVIDYPLMLVSYHDGWDTLSRQHPTATTMLLKLVLPAVILPVSMILYAASRHGAYYAPDTPASAWIVVAELFFVAQLMSVPLMAWVIQSIAETQHISCRFDRCFQLAATSAIPLWLSSLTLLVPNILFNAACVAGGLGAAFSLMYHGLPTMIGEEEGVDAMGMAYTVIAAGATLWVLLVALVLMPML
jgi:hypothetical protein